MTLIQRGGRLFEGVAYLIISGQGWAVIRNFTVLLSTAYREQMEEKERKRAKLLNWMKERQLIEKKKYLETLDEKRATEFRPFHGGQVLKLIL